MSDISSQRWVRQRTEVEVNERQARIMDWTVIAERNVVRADIMVPSLNSIYETIQQYQWTYLYTCACVVLTRLVRLFYANLEVAQDDERGTVLQSTVDGHIITVDPQIISQFIGVPVLDLPASPFNEVVLPPSMDEL
jgi:transaldolase